MVSKSQFHVGYRNNTPPALHMAELQPCTHGQSSWKAIELEKHALPGWSEQRSTLFRVQLNPAGCLLAIHHPKVKFSLSLASQHRLSQSLEV